MLKVGLIGCGHIMPAHLHGYKALAENGVDVRIRALCARKVEDAKRFRSPAEGVPPVKPVGPLGDPMNRPTIYVSDFQKDTHVEIYSDYREMFKKSEIDAVEIYTSVFSHHEIALACIEAGKHVLVEKPFALTVKAGRRMVERAEHCGVVLGVAESMRYSADVRMTKWAIDQGYIGDVQVTFGGSIGGYWSPDKIVAETAWRHKKMLAGGGATIDVGVHLLHFLRYFCGEIDEISSIVETLEKNRFTRDKAGKIIEKTESEVDDSFFSLIKFKTGAMGQLFFSWGGHGEAFMMPRIIYGTKGCIESNSLIHNDGTKADISELFERNAKKEVKEKFFPYGIKDSMALETLEFLKAIKEDREMETSGREGLRDLAASYALIESSLGRKAVKVDDVESGKIGHYEKEINKHYGI
jgi:1,5-anhydro-D-fructose reductase (1,5-anhydro-D-mannitol-forming)